MSEKTLSNVDTASAKKSTSDIAVVGNPDIWVLICKASSESQGFMKSTKAMQCPEGCVVQVTTQQRNPDGSYAIAEALAYVPGMSVPERAGT